MPADFGLLPAKPQPDGVLVESLPRAWRWQKLLDRGVYSSVTEIAEAERIAKSYVSRILRLALLAPDVVGAILGGWADQRVMLERLERPLPIRWEMTALATRAASPHSARMGRLLGSTASPARILSMQIVRVLASIRTVRATIISSLLTAAHSCSSRPIPGPWRRGLSQGRWLAGSTTEAPFLLIIHNGNSHRAACGPLLLNRSGSHSPPLAAPIHTAVRRTL